ncbi:MAG: biotin-dependent carboxyltransferase family protein [Noviherbaspirillum sp.]
MKAEQAMLKVVGAGLHSTVQDMGRTGFQDVGVPRSGPLDRISFRLANALVGNPQDAPALEMLMQGPALEVMADSVRVAVVGANAPLEVEGANRRTVAPGQSATLVRGDVLRVSRLGDSACAYLAVEGGIDAAPSLGSVSTYVRGSLGGLAGRPLRQGDLIPVRQGAAAARGEQAMARPLDLGLRQTIRVVPGPQDDYFAASALDAFLSGRYVVSAQADRMGFRLEGPVLEHAKGYNIVSDGIVAGSIQVPGSGLPIVLMADAQTTGGYPKIATVISADIPFLGRRKPGMEVRFAAVSVAEAEALRRRQEEDLLECMRSFRAVEGRAGMNLKALYSESLISGVVYAR